METVPGCHFDKPFQTVGDLFHFPHESPHPDQNEEFERTVDYTPMEVVVVLMEFASFELR